MSVIVVDCFGENSLIFREGFALINLFFFCDIYGISSENISEHCQATEPTDFYIVIRRLAIDIHTFIASSLSCQFAK